MEIAEKSKKILELGSKCRAVRKVGELHGTEMMLSLLSERQERRQEKLGKE